MFFNRPDRSCGMKKEWTRNFVNFSQPRANVDGSNFRCFVRCFCWVRCGGFFTSKSPRDFGKVKLFKSEPG